jgi:hypothetical protein
MMERDYVVMAYGTPIRVAGTARGANRLVQGLLSGGLVVEGVEHEHTVSMLAREAEAIGLNVREEMPSISRLMGEIAGLPLGSERYWELLDELVFWIPFVSRRSWKEMALSHLERLGWEDESIPAYPSVPEVLYGCWQGR